MRRFSSFPAGEAWQRLGRGWEFAPVNRSLREVPVGCGGVKGPIPQPLLISRVSQIVVAIARPIQQQRIDSHEYSIPNRTTRQDLVPRLSHHRAKAGSPPYQAKWANALFASAMRWVFSRVVTAFPSPCEAS